MNSNIGRMLGLVAVASIAIAACSSSGSSPAPSAAAATSAPSTAASAGGSGAAPGGSISCQTGSTTAAGSTAMQPLVDAAAKAYMKDCSGATITVQGGGSGTGLTQVSQGTVQIGNSDVYAEAKLQPADASALVDHQVVRQAWVIVLNQSVTGVTNLTTQQAKDIWTGKITNWKDVGGPDQPIVLILRPASSGTRATFKQIVLGGADEAQGGQTLTEDSNGTVAQTVQTTPGGTSYIGLAYYEQNKDKLIGTALDGVNASIATIQDGTYKLQAFGHMYTKGQPTGLTQAFINYMYSPAAQQIAAGLFYAPGPATPVPYSK